MAVERKLIREHKKRVMVREFLHKETERAGFGGAEIQRTPMGTRINLVAERPGFVIGRRGSTIKKLTADVAARFDLDNPQIEVQESRNSSLNSQIMAQKLAEALERGWHFRRAGHSTLRRIMEAGAKGAQITMSGKVTGGRSRVEKFTAGHIKHCGDTATQFMKVGFATAKKKLGTIGVKVAIMDPNAVLPDEIAVEAELPEGVELPAAAGADEAPAAVEGAPGGSDAAAAPASDPEVEVEETTTEVAEAAESEAEVAADAEVAPEVEAAAEAEEAPAAPEPAGDEAPQAELEGELTDIGGVGKAKATALEDAGYSDLDAVLAASEDELAEVEGIGPKLAKKIKAELEKMRK